MGSSTVVSPRGTTMSDTDEDTPTGTFGLNCCGFWVGSWTFTWRNPDSGKWGIGLDDGIYRFCRIGLGQ